MLSSPLRSQTTIQSKRNKPQPNILIKQIQGASCLIIISSENWPEQFPRTRAMVLHTIAGDASNPQHKVCEEEEQDQSQMRTTGF